MNFNNKYIKKYISLRWNTFFFFLGAGSWEWAGYGNPSLFKIALLAGAGLCIIYAVKIWNGKHKLESNK